MSSDARASRSRLAAGAALVTAALVAAALVGCTSPARSTSTAASGSATAATVPKKDVPMHGPTPNEFKLALVLSPKGWSGPLLPEQGPIFAIHLQNGDTVSHAVTSLDDHPEMLIARLYDDSGALLRESAPGDGQGGHHHEPRERAFEPVDLAPSAELASEVNLWEHGEPLGPGRYAVEIEQRGPTAPVLVSNRFPFEITAATIDTCAVGFDSPARISSILAWIATRPGARSSELLVRLSAAQNHLAVREGALDHGAVSTGTRLSLSRIAPGGHGAWLGWIALTTPGQVELIRHNNAHPQWRTGPLPFPLADAIPVPQFPDRDGAVYLATGTVGGRPALGGLVVHEKVQPSASWTVHLGNVPVRAACAFGPSGAISVLTVSDDGTGAKIARIDVDENGTVLTPEQVVRTTPNRVVGLAADLRADAPASFVVLESNRTMPDRLALIRLPLAGQAPPIVPFAPLAGWPQISENGVTRALAATELAFDVGPDGTAELLIIDERGRLYGGRLDGAGGFLRRDPGTGKAHCAHLAPLGEHDAFGSFGDLGLLQRPGGH